MYSLRPHGIYSPWNSPGKNTEVGSHSILQGIIPDPGIELRSPTLQADSLLSAQAVVMFGQNNWCWGGGWEGRYITAGFLDQEADENLRSLEESLKCRESLKVSFPFIGP